MGLFTPFWKLDSPYSKKAQSVYQKIDALTDQSLLEKIAIEAPLAEVRERAVKKIVNQIIISKVILEDKNFDVRFRAIHRSSDLELLKKIVVTDKSYSHGGGHRYTLAAAAWSVLVSNNALDEAFLERLALDESIEVTIRSDAIEQLSNQSLLEKLASDNSPVVSNSAISRLKVLGISYGSNTDMPDKEQKSEDLSGYKAPFTEDVDNGKYW